MGTKDYSAYWSFHRGDTVGKLVRRWAEERPRHAALVFNNREISWSELNEASDRLATHLVQQGFNKGDRLGVLGLNHPEAVYAWIAAAKVGVLPVSLSARHRRQELDYALKDAGCKGLVTLAAHGDCDFVELAREINSPLLKHIIVYGRAAPPRGYGAWLLSDILDKGESLPGIFEAQGPESFEPLFLLYTSGTTGVPKGVVHSHDSFLGCTKVVLADCWHLTKDDRLILSVPFCHMIGHEVVFSIAVLLGCTVVLQEQYNAEEFISLIERARVTFWVGVPSMLLLPILRMPDLRSRDLDSFSTGVTCGYYMTAEQMRRCVDTYGITLLQLVGSTELGAMLTTYRGDPPEVAYGSVGRGLRNQEIRIVDARNRQVNSGEVGEILCRGANVCLGYWRKPELTAAEIDAGGFWHSGDLGRTVDDKGSIVLLGRKKEIIKRGGFNIYPGEIERILSDLPKISESVVFGYPDEVLGEKICALVIPKPGQEIATEEIKELCRKTLADYKCPDRIHVVDTLPRTPMGKVDRLRVATEFADQALKEKRAALG